MPKNKLIKKDLEDLEVYFKDHRTTNKYIDSSPYFNFIKHDDLYDEHEIRKLCLENNWKIEEIPLSFNVFLNPIPFSLESKMHFSISDFSNDMLKEIYFKLLTDNFNMDYEDLGKISISKRKAYIILIYDNGQPVWGGSLHLNHNSAFMTWGCVEKQARNKGVSSMLTAISKMIAFNSGVSGCIYSTRNKLLKDKYDKNIEMYICRKKS